MTLSKKAKQVSLSLTLAITAKAKQMKANGVDVVSFGAGEPDFNTPENIQEAAIRAMSNGLTKYTPASGILELKKAICNKFSKDNNISYKPSQIIISNGAKQCLANAFQAILNPGDEVILAVPYWVSYPELIKLADGIPVFVDTKKENSFKFTIEDLEKAITENTKAIVVNSPNNPTGTIYSKEELEKIAEFSKKHNLYIISDEIYEKLIYENKEHISIASISEDAYKRTIIINGVSKTYSMTGWRIGYCAADEEIIKLMSNIQSHTTSNPNSIAQYATLEAIEGDQTTVNNMKLEFEKRKNYMIKRIEKMKGVSFIKPYGAFYLMLNISKFFGKTINGINIKDSISFADALLDSHKVAVVPGIGFGIDDYIRLSYAASMENIEEGLNRIESFIDMIK
ncbi:aspartate aminotransferase [Clostridium acetireducens DSM 10703]|jgi:aspartate aminotransferase|uniref:Aminotransferase n=1 Tax=Clostridium acetireducens DSM 10703 TaxID=1121290 RepID=A0A1E8F2B5_9CLOT|nr:pyridoxal phosphate-dependent aminotransferase [Clostridium acetireducens]OFI07749.1 aspartate aminotransferase [Clostridium acetireducens DSM 10703]